MTYYQTKLKDYRKKGKYNNVRLEYNGIKYHSKLEAKFAQDLDFRLKSKDIQGWDRQVKIEINVVREDKSGVPILTSVPQLTLKKEGKKFFHITNYFMDFVIYHNDGTEEFVECKGMELPEWKLKWKFTEAIFNYERPNTTLTLVK